MPRIFTKSKPAAAEPVDVERIRELLQVAVELSAAEVEIETGGVRVVVRQHASSVVLSQAAPMPAVAVAPEPAPEPPPSEPESTPENVNGTVIKAPTPGTFYARPAPEQEPFVVIGDRVSIGDTLCILEAMKLMNEIESEVSGVVKEILVTDGEPVEYDQPLFLIAT